MVIYLPSYLCKPEHTMVELKKKAAKEATGKEVMQKLHATGNIFLTKWEVSSHKAANWELSLNMRSFNIATEFVPTGLKKQRMRILKSLVILDKVDPEDTNIYAPNIIGRYKNCPDNLDDMWPADFAASHVYEKTNMNYEPDDEKSFIKPVTDINKE